MLRALLLLAALALASCGPEPPTPDPLRPDPTAAAETTRTVRPDAPSTPFDTADVVVDSTEPPEQVVQIPPRPAPRPIIPRPTPPPPPQSGPSGSCDVRSTVGYCLAFAGPGWTPADARAVCDEAPESTFGPGACPLKDRIATCAFEQPSKPGQEIVYTYYAPYDLALAELACPGRFTRIE